MANNEAGGLQKPYGHPDAFAELRPVRAEPDGTRVAELRAAVPLPDRPGRFVDLRAEVRLVGGRTVLAGDPAWPGLVRCYEYDSLAQRAPGTPGEQGRYAGAPRVGECHVDARAILEDLAGRRVDTA